MTRRFVIGSFQVPGYGGAATVGYQIFESLQQRGFDVRFLNIVAHREAAYLRRHYGAKLGNPNNLPGVRTHFLQGPTYDAEPELGALLDDLAPDVLMGVDFIAALLLKRAGV